MYVCVYVCVYMCACVVVRVSEKEQTLSDFAKSVFVVLYDFIREDFR